MTLLVASDSSRDRLETHVGRPELSLEANRRPLVVLGLSNGSIVGDHSLLNLGGFPRSLGPAGISTSGSAAKERGVKNRLGHLLNA